MDQEENNQLHHSLGIFNRLFNLITKRLTEAALKLTILGRFFSRGLTFIRRFFKFMIQNLLAQAMKPVTLGPPVHHRSPGVPSSNSELGVREWPSQESRPRVPSSNSELVIREWSSQELRPPRKTVSINDRVEMVIVHTRQGKERKKASDKLPSMEGEVGGEPNPLKSILKVGSNLK